jgi:hypothetical protein
MFLIGDGISQYWRNKFSLPIVVSVARDSSPTLQNELCRYLHSARILWFTPNNRSAREAKFIVISPKVCKGADSVLRPCLRLLHSWSRYNTHEYFGGKWPFFNLSSHTFARVATECHLSFALPGLDRWWLSSLSGEVHTPKVTCAASTRSSAIPSVEPSGNTISSSISGTGVCCHQPSLFHLNLWDNQNTSLLFQNCLGWLRVQTNTQCCEPPLPIVLPPCHWWNTVAQPTDKPW